MIIGIVGKISSGKDTVGKIIQMLTDGLLEGIPADAVEDCVLNTPILNPSWEIVKYAGKLKDCVCLILGCTREDLEDSTFKETELGEEWWFWTNQDCGYKELIPYSKEGYDTDKYRGLILHKLTPRLLLQLLGTDCGRQIIHPNIWVNSTMADYKPMVEYYDSIMYPDRIEKGEKLGEEGFPNWIITDVRFPNEVKAIQDKRGIIIKVMRDVEGRFPILYKEWGGSTYNDFYHYVGEKHPDFYKKIMHESETALDGFTGFNASIMNDFSILDTVKQLKYILKIHKIWMKED